MIRPDAATYQALVESSFLREEFAWTEDRTTVANQNRSWRGLYLYGENNYFEFLDPVTTPWSSPDGIAFGVNEPGAGREIQGRLQTQLEREVGYWPRTRVYDGREVPWFDYIGYNQGDEPLWSWVMEFHPDFLKAWHPELPPSEGGITHRAVLTRYRATLGERDTSAPRYFKDVTEVMLALPPEVALRLAQKVATYGYTVAQNEQGLRCEGPTDRLFILPATPSYSGIIAFKMALHRNKPAQTLYRFGSQSTLMFHNDQTATWMLRGDF